MNKVVKNVEEALVGVQDGMTLMLGGFGLCGIPENSIGKTLEKKNGVPVEKSESEFPISEFRYYM